MFTGRYDAKLKHIQTLCHPVCGFISQCYVLSIWALNTSSIFPCLIRFGIELTNFLFRGKHANHYIVEMALHIGNPCLQPLKYVSSTLARGEVCSIICDTVCQWLRAIGGFLWVPNFRQHVIWLIWHTLNIVEYC